MSAQLKDRSATMSLEHITAARKMLSSLPASDSDDFGNERLDPLSDSGDDDPDLVCTKRGDASLQEKAPIRLVWYVRV